MLSRLDETHSPADTMFGKQTLQRCDLCVERTDGAIQIRDQLLLRGTAVPVQPPKGSLEPFQSQLMQGRCERRGVFNLNIVQLAFLQLPHQGRPFTLRFL